jgi:hypothetical protein
MKPTQGFNVKNVEKDNVEEEEDSYLKRKSNVKIQNSAKYDQTNFPLFASISVIVVLLFFVYKLFLKRGKFIRNLNMNRSFMRNSSNYRKFT